MKNILSAVLLGVSVLSVFAEPEGTNIGGTVSKEAKAGEEVIEVTTMERVSVVVKAGSNQQEIIDALQIYRDRENLEELLFDRTSSYPATFFDALGRCESVKNLSLAKVGKNGLIRVLEYFPNLERLTLYDAGEITEKLPLLARCRIVDIVGKVSNESFLSLCEYRNLEYAALSFTKSMNMETLQALSKMKAIRTIEVESKVDEVLHTQIKNDDLLSPYLILHKNR